MSQPASPARCSDCNAPFTSDVCTRRALAMALADTPPPINDNVSVAQPPRRFGAYVLYDELGRGGNGIIYRAWQPELHRMVALKTLARGYTQHPDARRRLQREAELIASLDHPNILPVYAAGEHDGIPFYAAKLASGGSLSERVATYRGNHAATARLLATLARAVAYAHGRGVLHRDLKPSNVVFDDTGRCMLADFGLARTLDRANSLTATNTPLGTPHYSAPELLIGGEPITAAVDVYGLGAILYELLTGETPFADLTPLQLLRRAASVRPRSPRAIDPRIDPRLATLCLRCLERRPHDRLPSADALANALEAVVPALRTHRHAHLPDWLMLPSRRRAWSRGLLLAGSAIAGMALLAAASRGSFSTGPDPTIAAGTIAVVAAHTATATPAERAATIQLTAALRTQGVVPSNIRLRRSVRADTFAGAAPVRAFTEVRVRAIDTTATPTFRIEAIDVLRGERLWRGTTDLGSIKSVARPLAHALAARQSIHHKEAKLLHAALAATLRGRTLYTRSESAANDAAIAAYQQAIAATPGYALPHALLSLAYTQRSNRFGGAAFWNDSAIEEAERAIRLEPRLAVAHGALGYAYYTKGWWRRASTEYVRARALGWVGADDELALIHYGTGQFVDAFQLYRARVTENPDSDGALYLGAQTLFAVGATGAGERWMHAAIALEPHAGKRQLMQAEIAAYRGDHPRCRALTAKLDPDLVSGGFGSAADIARTCAEHAHDWRGALALLQHAKQQYARGTADLGNAGPMLEEAVLLHQLGRPADAEPMLDVAQRAAQAAIDGGREYPKIWLRMATAKRLRGDLDGAYRALDHAFANGLTINHRNADDFEFLPFKADARFAALRATSVASVAAMRSRLEPAAAPPLPSADHD